MTDLEDRIRSSLHAAAEHLPDSHASRVQALDLAFARKPRLRGPLVALAAFLAVLVVLGGTILLWGGVAEDTPVVVGQPETVTTDELDAAVRPAVNALADAPGLVATQEVFFDGQPGESVWVDYRSNGNFISLLAADLALVGTGSSEPGRIEKSAAAYIDGTFYQASIPADGIDVPWHELEEEPDLPEPPIPLGVLPEILYPSHTEEPGIDRIEATRQNMSDGGTRWTLTIFVSDGSFTQRWEIHPDGHLRTYSVETDQLVDPSPIPSGRIDFTPLASPDPIAPPEIGTTLNPAEYDIPEDLALLP